MVERWPWGLRRSGEAWLGAGQGTGGGAGADLSEVALLGVLQSEFMDAMEMMDICL